MKRSIIFKTLIFCVMAFTLLVSNGLAATPTPTASAGWIPYLPTPDQVTITFSAPSTMYVDLTFSSTGYRVADPGQVAVAAGVNPDGTTYLSNITVGTKIEAYTGPVLTILTTLRITYQVHSGDTTYFAFQVNRNGQDVKVKEITVKKVPLYPTPTIKPTPSSNPTPTPTLRTVTPTPTRLATPTPTTRGGLIVKYEIISDWGTGATISITIINNTATAVNGWTLAWTFPGNQRITNVWNASFTQSGASVSVKDGGFNGSIPANGGSVTFGFNISYSGGNPKPTNFTLNGTPCQVQ